jgi:hypothetical protein
MKENWYEYRTLVKYAKNICILFVLSFLVLGSAFAQALTLVQGTTKDIHNNPIAYVDIGLSLLVEYVK